MKREELLFGSEMPTFLDLRRPTSWDSDHPRDHFACKNFNLRPRRMNLTPEDLKVVHNLNRLDQLVIKFADPDRHDELLWDVQQGVMERFNIWLTQKGFDQNRSTILTFSEIFLTFIYGVNREEPITLKSASGQSLTEFMVNYLFRNTSMKVGEYALCPSAIRLLYLFLQRKGYLIDLAGNMITLVEKIEPLFLYLLRERYDEPKLQHLAHEV